MTAFSVLHVENNSILRIRLEDNNHGVSPSSFNIRRFKSPDSFVICFLDQRAKKQNYFLPGIGIWTVALASLYNTQKKQLLLTKQVLISFWT